MLLGSGSVPPAFSVAKFLGVPLLDHSEAAELAFLPVKVAVMVGVARNETVVADQVMRLHTLHHMHRERQAA